MRIVIILLVVLTAGGIATHAYLQHAAANKPPTIVEVPVSRGDVLETVIATGTVSADRSVSVGTQVSGLVQKVFVDFNSIVTKGELLAELDPAPIQAQLDSANAMLGQAKLAETQEETQLQNDEINAGRAETLYAQSLLDEQDREDAERQVKIDQTQIVQDKAAINIAAAAVSGSETDLANCRIASPIDGVVIERDVDVGQAVASRVAAPTLFILGTDLRHLRVVGDVDESDIAKIHPGQIVGLSVDAYPNMVFTAVVTSARLNATVASNVVTYQVVADVDNSKLQLRPGMTATMKFEVWRASDVVRVPTVALRFRPTLDMFKMLHQTPVEAPTIAAEAHPATPGAPHAGAPPSSLAVLSTASPATPSAGQPSKPRLVDALFAVPKPPDAAGHVWVMRDHHLTLVPVHISITDGRYAALVDGDLKDGDEVVTNVLK